MAIRECDCKEFQDSGHTDECKDHYGSVRKEAERRVLAVRGSWDTPGFEACVKAEMRNIAQGQQTRDSVTNKGEVV